MAVPAESHWSLFFLSVGLIKVKTSYDFYRSQEEDEGLYDVIQMLRDQTKQLQERISCLPPNSVDAMKCHQQLRETQKALFMQNEQRRER